MFPIFSYFSKILPKNNLNKFLSGQKKACKRQIPVKGRYTGQWMLLASLVLVLAVLPSLGAYQWPLPTRQIVQGFLASSSADNLADKRYLEQHSLPNLGVWFEVKDKPAKSKDAQNLAEPAGQVKPYHAGEIIYFENSTAMNMLGPIPQNIAHTIIVKHGKLLFRYSGENLDLRLQQSYQVDRDHLLFAFPPKKERENKLDKENKAARPKSRLYMEIFDIEFQTVINPKLLMPSVDYTVQAGQLYVESVSVSEVVTTKLKGKAKVELSAVKPRPLRKSDQLLRGIYNLSFRFPKNQGPPLKLNIGLDEKVLYSELFDQVYGINSKLITNDRDLQDVYTLSEKGGNFLLGTLNLQDKLNSFVDVSVAEEYIDGSHSTQNYRVRIR